MKQADSIKKIKINNNGMHLDRDVYESILLRLGRMVDIIKVYILILVYVTLTLMEGHSNVRKQELLH